MSALTIQLTELMSRWIGILQDRSSTPYAHVDAGRNVDDEVERTAGDVSNKLDLKALVTVLRINKMHVQG